MLPKCSIGRCFQLPVAGWLAGSSWLHQAAGGQAAARGLTCGAGRAQTPAGSTLPQATVFVSVSLP